jgi:hypothetical protein
MWYPLGVMHNDKENIPTLPDGSQSLCVADAGITFLNSHGCLLPPVCPGGGVVVLVHL